jgi:putative tricarboxylic transport membrane protein
MKNKDTRLSLILMAIFLALFGISFTFPESTLSATHTSAAFFPRVVLIMAMILTLIMILQNIRKKEVTRKSRSLDKEQRFRVLGSMVISILFALGAVYIGTYVSLFFLIAVMMIIWGVRDKVAILLNALLTPLLIYLVFTKLLLVQFPSGFLF